MRAGQHLRLRVDAHLELDGGEEVGARDRLPPLSAAGSEHSLGLRHSQRPPLAAIVHLLVSVVLLLLLLVLLLLMLLLLLLSGVVFQFGFELLGLLHLGLRCHVL